jgi:hypothetical protein
MKGGIVYRIESDILTREVFFSKGEIISHETLMEMVADGWIEIEVTIITVQ